MNKISVPPTDNSGWQVVHVGVALKAEPAPP